MNKILFFFGTLLWSISALAQDCYNYTRTQAISYYNKGDYTIAKNQFSAAKACPDKPTDNDLDYWIGRCNSAIRQAEERRRQVAEEANRKRIEEQQYASKGYMNIHKIEFANGPAGGTLTDAYGSSLKAANIKYLYSRIYYTGLIESSKTITVYVKIIDPDGTLETGESSPSGYTYSKDITIEPGAKYANLNGWGNATEGSYTAGDYKCELWYNGNKIYTQNFTLQGPASASYLKVDNKTAVSSSYSADGGTETYYVSTDGPSYEVRLLPDWCSVTNKTSSSFTIRWAANNTGSSRSDWFQVKSGSKEVRIDVSQISSGPSASIDRVWVDHNYFYGGNKGMMIHVKFTTYKMLNKQGECNAYFYFENGTALKDYNGYYKTVSGKVSVGETFTPSYESSEYSDFKLFIPYTELHISSSGSYSLKFQLQIFHGQKVIATSDYVAFSLTI